MGDYLAAARDLQTGLNLKPDEDEARQLLARARQAATPKPVEVSKIVELPKPAEAPKPLKRAKPLKRLGWWRSQKPSSGAKPVKVSKSVELPRPAVNAPAPARFFVVQVGAFSNLQRAEQLCQALEKIYGVAQTMPKPVRRPCGVCWWGARCRRRRRRVWPIECALRPARRW